MFKAQKLTYTQLGLFDKQLCVIAQNKSDWNFKFKAQKLTYAQLGLYNTQSCTDT